MNNGDNVVMSEEVDGNGVSRTLQLRLVNELDFTGYFCRGFNGFSSASSNVALVTRVGEYMAYALAAVFMNSFRREKTLD